MKIVFFAVLALFAFCAHGVEVADVDDSEYSSVLYDSSHDERRWILDYVIAYVKSILNEIKKIIERIVKKSEDIVRNVRTDLEKIAAAAGRNLEKIVEGIENKFKKIAETNKAARACLNEYIPKIKSSVGDSRTFTGLCIKGSIDQATNIINDVHKHIEAIQDHLNAMQDVVSQCLEQHGKVLEAAKCVFHQTSEFKKNIFEMIGNAKDLVVDANKRAVTIVSDGTKCIIDANKAAEKEIVENVKALEKCVKAGAE